MEQSSISNDRDLQCTSLNYLNINNRDDLSKDSNSNITSPLINICASNREHLTSIKDINLVDNEETLKSIIILNDDLNTINSEQTDNEENEVIYEVLFEKPIEISDQMPSNDIMNIIQSTVANLNQNDSIDQNVSVDDRNSKLLLSSDTNTKQYKIKGSINQNHEKGM